MILTSTGSSGGQSLFRLGSGVRSITLNNGFGTFNVTANGNTISVNKNTGNNSTLNGKLIVFY